MFEPRYEAQVRLLLRCLPEISRHPCFAIKGGTAINFFVRDLPRVSVDIDLTYLPLKVRDDALQEVHGTLITIKDDIEQHIPSSRVRASRSNGFVVKVEPNLIMLKSGVGMVDHRTMLDGSNFAAEAGAVIRRHADREPVL